MIKLITGDDMIELTNSFMNKKILNVSKRSVILVLFDTNIISGRGGPLRDLLKVLINTF